MLLLVGQADLDAPLVYAQPADAGVEFGKQAQLFVAQVEGVNGVGRDGHPQARPVHQALVVEADDGGFAAAPARAVHAVEVDEKGGLAGPHVIRDAVEQPRADKR